MKYARDYLKLVNEVINMQVPFKTEIIGTVVYDQAYPILKLSHEQKLAKYNVLINAGAHGDEAIGVRVLLKFLAEFKKKYLDDYNFHIYPCTNPYGYAHLVRRNGAKQMTNNSTTFSRESEVQELRIIYPTVPLRPDLFIDVHADTDKSNVYIYERKPENMQSVAKKVLESNKEIIPYEEVGTIYREKVENGVIVKPEHDRSLDDYMANAGVGYTITLEIPGKAEGHIQLNGGICLLHAILEEYLRVRKKAK